MPQFLINSKDVKNNIVCISDKDNYNHIAKSLRIKKDEKLLLIDENSIQYETVVDNVNTKEIKVLVKNSYKSKRKLDFELFLAQSPLRSDAQNFIIEKATELGVEGVYPIYTDNCALKKSIIEAKIPKWQKIMFEAFKQCERANVPTCFQLTDIESIIKMKNNSKIIAFCERYTDLSLHKYFSQNLINDGEKLIVIIGPEGGFRNKNLNCSGKMIFLC